MGKFERSWMLFKASMAVINQNRKLLIFPALIAVLTVIIVLFFLAPVALQPTGHGLFTSEHWSAVYHSIFTETRDVHGRTTEPKFTAGAWAYLIFLYFVTMGAATFFNVAFYNEILAALEGRTVSIRRGLVFAANKWKAVLMWTLFAGLIGLIIRLIEERLDVVGKWVAQLVGVAWSIAAIFAIPVIVRQEEAANPLKALRASAGLLKRTWGEALIGYIGMSAGNLMAFLASLGILIVGGLLSLLIGSAWPFIASLFLWFMAFFAWCYLMSVAGQVYKGALYLYASSGAVAGPYDRAMLDSAWKFKG